MTSRLHKVFTTSSKVQKKQAPQLPVERLYKCLQFHPLFHFLSLIFQIFTHECEYYYPAGLCGSWETENGTLSSVITVDQKTVVQPEATETVGMTQPAEEENVTPKQTIATTENKTVSTLNLKNEFLNVPYFIWIVH